MSFAEKFNRVETLPEIFELVKDCVRDTLEMERCGLMLGLAELGIRPGFFLGAFYQVGSNAIIMNKTAMRTVKSNRPELYKAYCFHVLLHEYLHTLGFLNEREVESFTYGISKECFGDSHEITEMSRNFATLFPYITFQYENLEPERLVIDFITDFDSSNTSYIG